MAPSCKKDLEAYVDHTTRSVNQRPDWKRCGPKTSTTCRHLNISIISWDNSNCLECEKQSKGASYTVYVDNRSFSCGSQKELMRLLNQITDQPRQWEWIINDYEDSNK